MLRFVCLLLLLTGCVPETRVYPLAQPWAIETPVCNLFMSMLDRMGVDAPFIGDSTGRLSGLSV